MKKIQLIITALTALIMTFALPEGSSYTIKSERNFLYGQQSTFQKRID